MMRLDIAVIACDIVQECDLARFSNVAEFVQDPMDGGQRDVGMLAPHGGANLVGAGMVLRSQQGSYDGEPLGRDRDSPLVTAGDEVAKSLSGIPLVPRSIQKPEFPHFLLLPGQQD